MKTLFKKFKTITIQGHILSEGDRFGTSADSTKLFWITEIIDDTTVTYRSISRNYGNSSVQGWSKIYPDKVGPLHEIS